MSPMKIGVHTHITNPLSSGYLAYLACIESWARVADEVVVIDGGSTDDSLSLLKDWLGEPENVRILSPPEAYWGVEDDWEWPQIAINRQIGLEHLQTDWAIHVDADHVVDRRTVDSIRSELAGMSDRLLLEMWVGGYTNGNYQGRQRKRAWILNWGKVRAENRAVAYGIKSGKAHLDYPLHANEERTFRDPITGVSKRYYLGEYVPVDGVVDLECFRYGHFFFTMDQCLEKSMRIERAIGRYRRTPSRYPSEIRHQLKFAEIENYESKTELLAKEHPPEIRRLIEHFYEEGMLGGAVYGRHSFSAKLSSSAAALAARMWRILHRLT